MAAEAPLKPKAMEEAIAVVVSMVFIGFPMFYSTEAVKRRDDVLFTPR
ncbi:hypothetical protein CZ787_05730 [Halomonas citrativorans]|uniref:Uncharacterized protein n=1 Tax=Halomonas citrativorans TaxID=2742612 RepID=A0A1R4HUW2_9GAMM|nr:hypothetical protein CZ787_05730 [Halomonas citrativorans]